MGFKDKSRNRRLSRRPDILDVKVRSKVARAARTRLAVLSLGTVIGTLVGVFVLWQLFDWTLDRLVYGNSYFAIRQIEVHTDGVIAEDQLRRWSGVRGGQNLLALDLGRVKHELENWPMIKTATVERVLPDTLRFRVVEREPVAQLSLLQTQPARGLEERIFHVDSDGYVFDPLDPRERAVPLGQANEQLPMIMGLNPMEVQPGRRLNPARAQAALQWIGAFATSPMAGLVDVRRVDVSTPDILVVTTAQGSEITFGLEDFERQLGRWRAVQDRCHKENKVIVSLDLAVIDYTPLRTQEAGNAPPPPAKPKHPRVWRKNV